MNKLKNEKTQNFKVNFKQKYWESNPDDMEVSTYSEFYICELLYKSQESHLQFSLIASV